MSLTICRVRQPWLLNYSRCKKILSAPTGNRLRPELFSSVAVAWGQPDWLDDLEKDFFRRAAFRDDLGFYRAVVELLADI